MTKKDDEIAELTTDITVAYLIHNRVEHTQLPDVITSIHQTLKKLSSSIADAGTAVTEPFVPVKKSIKPDHLVCLCCGEKFKSLKRHIGTSHNLTPAQYRAQFGLKEDYPMTTALYSTRRSEIAIDIGLGKKKVQLQRVA